MPYDLIIPDIHEKIDVTDEIIARYPDCRFRYFLGDFWDSFEWEFQPDHWRRVARWLLKISQDSRNVLIAGNHDVNYYNNGASRYLCSGYIGAKHQMIAQEMPSNWLIQHCHWVYPVMHGDQMTLLSHAGLNVAHVRYGAAITPEYVAQINRDVSDNFFADIPDPRLEAGRGRGGRGIGGITWQDWDREFSGLPGVRQIVGHTPHVDPKWIGRDLCLDTHLGHVALMDCETGAITIEDV